jgi:tRNA A-37 threonylcarbamoyl transferase component Bud32
MQPADPEVSTCPNCGGVLEKTSGAELGCMSCLLRAGIGSEEETVHDPTPNAFDNGKHFGVYEIDHREDGSLYELGRGAMGVTYRATDTSLERKVALKIIKTDIAERIADARERFMREARAAAALRHENIATIYQFGMCVETGQYFYAMELIEGETLAERVRRAGPLDARTTIGIAQQVTSALAAAEKHGLVHRDLKPANLMLVSPDGETSNNEKLLVKIIDFGLAKAIHTAADPKSLTHDRFVGTPAFASPEQFEHSALDVRSDIYSLGQTLWFALTGKTPFAGHTISEIHRAQKSSVLPLEQLKAAHAPHRLRSLLESMLAFEPASRPGTHELAARLHRCTEKRSFFTELERRNVYKVAVAYAVAAWLLIQAASILFPTFDAPPWLMQIFVVILVIGFPATLVFSWAFEITPEGIVRESEVEHGKSITRRTGRKIVTMTVVLAIFAAGLLIFQVLHLSVGRSAANDYAEAMKLATGLGGTRIDLPKAAEYLQRAAAKNVPEAEARLAYWINNGVGGLARDHVKAEQSAKKALADGLAAKAANSAEAQTELATLYEFGLGAPKDLEKAAELYQKAAHQGNQDAIANLKRLSKPAAAFPPGIGGVRINTSPPGATAALGGLGAKKTPVTFNANPGKYSLFIELDGYEPVAHEVEAREGELVDLGTITLQRSKTGVELATIPQGAKVFQGDTLLGSTPLHLDNFPSGQTNFLFVLKGYLPRQIKAQLNSRETFKTTVTLAKALQVYKGMISQTVPITMKFGPLCASGIMTQSSTRGDTIVKFTGIWDGDTLRALSREVVSKPEGILWEPESFAIRFSDDGKSAFYQCNYGTEMFVAKLSAP